MAGFTSADVAVGRVISEDSGFILIEFLKDDAQTFTLQDGDRFYTVLFVQMEGSEPTFQKPWRS